MHISESSNFKSCEEIHLLQEGLKGILSSPFALGLLGGLVVWRKITGDVLTLTPPLFAHSVFCLTGRLPSSCSMSLSLSGCFSL